MKDKIKNFVTGGIVGASLVVVCAVLANKRNNNDED